jgi:hypothetical protein
MPCERGVVTDLLPTQFGGRSKYQCKKTFLFRALFIEFFVRNVKSVDHDIAAIPQEQ